MSAGSGDGSLEDHGGSYLERGKERQPSQVPEEPKEKDAKQSPRDLIDKAVKAARRDFERLTRIFP